MLGDTRCCGGCSRGVLRLLLLQVPNALLAEVKGTAGGCSAISISRDGRWLAAACGDDAGRFKVGGTVLGFVLMCLLSTQVMSTPVRQKLHTLCCVGDSFLVGGASTLGRLPVCACRWCCTKP